MLSQIILEKISGEKKKELGIPDACESSGGWGVWECEPSSFDWTYDDQEVAYIYEGKVQVKTDDQEVEINPGDFVIFPKGLSCRWTVIETVRKVYKFE